MFARMDTINQLQAERVLEHVLAQLFKRRYAPIKFRQFLDVSHEVPPGSETFSEYTMEEVGDAELTRDYADDAPSVDAFLTKASRTIYPIRAKFQYSTQEFLQAMLPGGQPVDALRASVAFNSIERKHNKVALTGNIKVGYEGLFNSSRVTPITTATTPGINGGWATATGDQIVGDVQTMKTKMIKDTLENYDGTYLILPTSAYGLVKTKRLDSVGPMTIYSYLLANFPGLTIDTSLDLNGAGTAATDRAVLYQKDPEVVQYHIPLEFDALAPQMEGHLWKVFCQSRTGGTQIRIPLAIVYADGI